MVGSDFAPNIRIVFFVRTHVASHDDIGLTAKICLTYSRNLSLALSKNTLPHVRIWA